MGDVSIFVPKAELCQVCHKRPATRLCDVILGEATYFDLPKRGEFSKETLTCDKKICDQCSIKINENTDICRHCWDNRITKSIEV